MWLLHRFLYHGPAEGVDLKQMSNRLWNFLASLNPVALDDEGYTGVEQFIKDNIYPNSNLEDVVGEARRLIVDKDFPWHDVSAACSTHFGSSEETRQWLEYVLNLTEEELNNSH